MPFTAVATNLLAGREVWFRRGAVDVAIRASIALPGLFTPVTVNERLLVDGGLVEPLPLASAAAVPADLTVAISLTGERDLSAVAPHETADPGPFDEWVTRIAAAHRRWAPSASQRRPRRPRAPRRAHRLEIIISAYEAMPRVLNRYRLARFPSTVPITVPKDACRTLDFHRATSMVELGRKLTADALDAFEAERAAPPTA